MRKRIRSFTLDDDIFNLLRKVAAVRKLSHSSCVTQLVLKEGIKIWNEVKDDPNRAIVKEWGEITGSFNTCR